MKHLLLLVVIGFAIGIVLGFMNISFNFWIFVGLLVVAFFVLSLQDIRFMFLSKDVKKMEKYLIKKKHEPYYGFILELANGNLPEAKKQLEDLEKKWKGKKTAIFRAQYYLRVGNIVRAKEEAELIEQPDMKNYVLAAIAAMEKDDAKVEALKPALKKEWMRHVIETERAINKKNLSVAKEKKEKALASTKGLQYFMIFKEYENL
ncbi:hypothetical protein JOC95_003401 [Bacillus tianshenii]|uniref:DUF2892 domain-containing protein n=1 Tax=Sutcliffiella tianshenii TaxID=1463404 RepID=A0ABS2P4F8_9BACI|nr:hypothetical protein [Bacillus tianshenii]MBM7621512.1 hypothetical protein [Bacillus tianshenii]